MLIRTACVAVAIAFSATAVIAQSDPISQRKETMKGVGGQARVGAQMVKGEVPFDLAKAQAVFATFATAAAKMPSLFPDNSKTGGETTAAPKIWEDMNGFKAGFAKFEAEAKTAQTSVKDLETFKVAFGNMGKNCGGCHETFRVKK
jgi:cytochrome c556